MTEKEKLTTAYDIGKARQSYSMSIALIFINMLLMLVIQPQQLGFSIAMLIISVVSALSHNMSIKKLEKNSGINEEELIKGHR